MAKPTSPSDKRPQLRPSLHPLSQASTPSTFDVNSDSRPKLPKVVTFGRTSPRRSFMDPANEHSPLLNARRSSDVTANESDVSPIDDDDDNDGWPGDDEETKSTLYLFLLTLGGLGLQIAWSVETSHGSPYLLSLGISKSFLALVWIAGPLSGTLVQPYVGMKSDNCRIRWGKRRPFIIGGGLATIVSLMLLAWAREIMAGILGLFGVDSQSYGVKITTILFAVLFVYVLDFAINVIQAGIRAYIVDCAPTHQQESANAWMIRTSGVGNILGYIAGYVNLPRYLPFLGDSQFKVLCAISSFILVVTVGISCYSIPERNPAFDPPVEQKDGLFAFFRSLGRSVRKLPPQIRRVCAVQFFAWIGWFPFLFYITTYIGEIYVQPYLIENPHMSDEEVDALWEKATRIGTLSLLIFAITTFLASVFLPFLIPPSFQAPPEHYNPATPMTPTTPMSMSMSMSGGGYFAMSSSKEKDSRPRTFSNRVADYFEVLQIKSLTLRRAWIISHVIFAALMVCTFFVRDVVAATVLVACVGVPWALTNWAPFALISSEISKRDAMRRGLIPALTHEEQLISEGEDDAASEGADQAGVILGIHNVAIAAPQVIATLVSSVIFKFFQKGRGEPGDDSVAWVLRFGGICALIAAYLTTRVGEEAKDEDDYFGRRVG